MSSLVLIKYPQSILDTLNQDATVPPDNEIGLSEYGKKVADQIGTNLAGLLKGEFSISSSPALRCTETAKIISGIVGGIRGTDERLDERKLFGPKAEFTVREFRNRQECGYLDPYTLSSGENESPLSHRIRVEGWLAEILGVAKSADIQIVVSHGAVIEHLHSSLSWKPAGAIGSTFNFCAPGHAHLWSAVELPDHRRIWCCLGANVNLADAASCTTPLQGFQDLNGLAVDLASDPRFANLARAASEDSSMASDYYIR
ncbi:phosphoglycerate mutase family protein [Rhodopirellula baltica]|uniref:phosphoglycerate mutase family protein n=1 Tax=Rhodopirellula baltica TaxID=265606 RepID=UPI00055A3C1C|nr:histidine phosphatase family protein [Rhodopirellula baltica]